MLKAIINKVKIAAVRKANALAERGRRYLEFLTGVVSASDTTVALLYCRASATLSREHEPAQLMQRGSAMHVGGQYQPPK